MNILVIWNGFDLAHGLPTTYKDFLDYAHAFKYYYETENKGLFEFADKYQSANYVQTERQSRYCGTAIPF